MTAAPTTSLLHAALCYADLGYPVFPCAPGGKVPLTKHGFHDATTDPDKIEQWWSRHPDANIGLPTQGMIVIDADAVDGQPNPWLDGEPEKQLDLTVAPMSVTPRGGSHHLFRQPPGTPGTGWRCTEGNLAPKVDTRADGGYIVVPPSIREDGKTYRWQQTLELDVPLGQLPLPPDWLVERLDRIARERAPLAQVPPGCEGATGSGRIPTGQRNATLARLAGGMRRMGMSKPEIAAALVQVNQARCDPPLPGGEVQRIAASIARYEPDAVTVALAENHWAQDRRPPAQPRPLSVRELMARHRTLRAAVICGLLRRGETMNVIAPPKTGKSWLVLGLAMCVATGRRWLDTFETVAGNVLIIDNELHSETLAHRIPQVAECLRIGINEIAETVSVQSLRGQLRDIFSLAEYFEAVEPGRYALVVLDAFYRFMPRDMDENDNGTMANIYNHVDALADRLGCSFVLIHHATKGNQSAKAVTDVGAGAGSQSRATDTHLVLRPHEEPGAVVLEAAVRSWPPIEPMPLRWLFPVWKPAPDLDPTLLKSERPKRSKPGVKPPEAPKQPAWTVERFVEAFLSDQPATKAEIRERVTDAPGLSWRRVSDFLDIGERNELIERVKLTGQGGPVGFVRCKPEASQ